MKFYEDRNYNRIAMLVAFAGILCEGVSLLFGVSLPDFWRGFLEGVAVAGVGLGVVHVAASLLRRRNPFTGRPMGR